MISASNVLTAPIIFVCLKTTVAETKSKCSLTLPKFSNANQDNNKLLRCISVVTTSYIHKKTMKVLMYMPGSTVSRCVSGTLVIPSFIKSTKFISNIQLRTVRWEHGWVDQCDIHYH